jgi:ubiquinone/menaquinone biosynthesis C-methylase UbiE
MPSQDAETFLEVQTQTGWGRTLAYFADWCQAKPGWRVLDIGCGPGLLPAMFDRQGCQAIGIDIDNAMFSPQPLHTRVACADAVNLPFDAGIFQLVTASNLLFLLPEPQVVLKEIRRVTQSGGQIGLLNPSELLNWQAAADLADARHLEGLARQSLLNWAARAESNHRWSESETKALLVDAGIRLVETEIKVGPGFARFARGIV